MQGTHNGVGIGVEYQANLFGMFQRFHGNAYPGTGIGLAIVRKAVERMEGNVGVVSHPGQGTRFWLELRKAA
jgi:signal transduction histidine kinase